MADRETQLWKDPANFVVEKRLLDANNSVVTAIHTTSSRIIVALDNGALHIFSHHNGHIKEGEKAKVVKASTRGIWCLASYEKSAANQYADDMQDWIVVGGTGNGSADEENLKVWKWDESGELIEQNKLQGHTSTVRVVKILTSNTIISGSRDSSVRIWNIEKGICETTLIGHTATVRCLDVHRNIAASGSYDNNARIWDLEKRVCLHVLRGHQSNIYAIATDGKRVFTGGLDKAVRVWSVVSGECQAVLGGFTSLVSSIQLCPPSMLTADANGSIVLWTTENFAEELWKIAAHENAVTSVRLDGSKIASGGADGKVKVWDASNGQLLQELVGTSDAVWEVQWIGKSLVAIFFENREVVMKIWNMTSAL